MEDKIKKFIEKKNIPIDRITCVIRTNKRTYIYTADGRVYNTYFSMKTVVESITTEAMRVINKGTAVNLKYVSQINNGKYEMADGRVLSGRVRTPGEHKRNLRLVESLNPVKEENGEETAATTEIEERFSILDEFPMPFAVFEVKLDDGKASDLLFRYLNPKMAELVKTDVADAKGRSFYSIFKNGDKKWLEINEEVVLTGKPNSINRFSPEVGKYLQVYHFCPAEGYSAFAVVK